MNISVRLATPQDAELCAQYVGRNTDIPLKDKEAVKRAKCPIMLVVEIDGKAELFMPLLPALTIGYLGFNPDQDPRTKARALRAMKKHLQELQINLGVEDAYVFTRPEYPMGKWALKNEFVIKDKLGFSLERKDDVQQRG